MQWSWILKEMRNKELEDIRSTWIKSMCLRIWSDYVPSVAPFHSKMLGSIDQILLLDYPQLILFNFLKFKMILRDRGVFGAERSSNSFMNGEPINLAMKVVIYRRLMSILKYIGYILIIGGSFFLEGPLFSISKSTSRFMIPCIGILLINLNWTIKDVANIF